MGNDRNEAETLRYVLAIWCIVTTGCVSTTQSSENMLSAAGFDVKIAETPSQIAALKALPAHQFTMQQKDGQPVYLYADPTVCGCLYVGNQAEYRAYQQMTFKQNLADQNAMAAQMMDADQWDYWDSWEGPWWS